MQVPMPLSQADYKTMNCSWQVFSERVFSLPEVVQYHVINSTHRLAEVEWLSSKLEDEVRTRGTPVVQEGLLSLQIYLLLTCADGLGHIHHSASGGVGQRFRAFF